MDDFSWSDTIKAAISPCSSCLRTTPDDTNINEQSRGSTPRAELEGLLADSGDTDNEAETLSLHSNIGDRRRKKKKRNPKNISIFGFNIFGKPPIRLEGEDSLASGSTARQGPRKPTISTSTLDSDAAPLDPSTIDRLSVALPDEHFAAEEEARRQKEERRRLRRERKELRRSLAAQEGFERFSGSAAATQANFPVSHQQPSQGDDFVQVDHLDADEEGADFEADMYTARKSGGPNRLGSDSRSRTSASTSDTSHNHQYISQQPGFAPQPSTHGDRVLGQIPPRRKSKTASSKTSSSKTSQSSSSLLSPVNSSFPITHPTIAAQDHMEFEGFPNDGSFPSVGFGGGKMRRGNSEMGVALARRGDD